MGALERCSSAISLECRLVVFRHRPIPNLPKPLV